MTEAADIAEYNAQARFDARFRAENPAYCKACGSLCDIYETNSRDPQEYVEPFTSCCGAHYEEAIDLTETDNAIEAVEYLINQLKEARRAA